MAPHSVSGGPSPDEELEELERKYAQLEGDRRSFFETSRWTIKQNRDTLAIAKVDANACKQAALPEL